jgi:hypothetical protein
LLERGATIATDVDEEISTRVVSLSLYGLNAIIYIFICYSDLSALMARLALVLCARDLIRPNETFPPDAMLVPK